MTRWIDHPDWSDQTARQLIEVLVQALRAPFELEEVWAAAGLPLGTVNVHSDPPRWVWTAMTKEAAKYPGALETLVRLVADRVPAAADRINDVLAVRVRGLGWYVSHDRYSAKLVGPGAKFAMLDRTGLRDALTSLVVDGYAMVAITGSLGSGKSHSRHLIQHVADDPRVACRVLMFVIDGEWPERRRGKITTADFVARLASKLAGPVPAADMLTDHTRTARELATAFVGWYQKVAGAPRWIFIDGLDRDDVHPGVHEFVGFLAGEVVDNQLPNTRLIVTGHPGNFAPNVADLMLEERLDPLDGSHLERFFTGIAADIQVDLAPEDVERLVRQVLAEADFTNLKQLGRVASTVAHEYFKALVLS